MLASLLLGMFVGAVLGLTGAGGGMMAVPLLVAAMGWSMQQAAPVALIAVAGSAAIGALDGFRRKLVRYRAALWMTLVGVPFTALGSAVAHHLPQRWLMGMFAAVMLLVAFRMFRSGRTSDFHGNDVLRIGHINADTGRLDWNWTTVLLVGTIGATTGFMTGLLGVGGGFAIVPLLRRFTNISMQGIVATSLLVIALVGAGGVMTAFAHGLAVPMSFCLFFTAATACGMVIGRHVSKYLSASGVQRGFAIMLIFVALALLGKATG